MERNMDASDNLFLNNGTYKIVPMTRDRNPYETTTVQDLEIRVYKRRWWILLLFTLMTGVNSYQWIQYSIIANIVIRFYGISSLEVDMTSMIYMIVYIPLFIPVSYWINKWGLRNALLVSTWCTCLGTWMKVFSVSPNSFYIGFAGQTLIALAQLFTFSVPAKLAATWFGPEQLSYACGLGVLGMTIGVALSFVVTPLVVRNDPDLEIVGNDLFIMFLLVAVYISVVSIAVQFFFTDHPPLPPSKAQALVLKTKEKTEEKILESFKVLLTNKPFLHLLMAYGLSMGVLNAISTLLNQILLIEFPNKEEFAGIVGLIIICAGLVSSPLFGYILDRTRKYKWTTFVIYLMSAIGMMVLTIAVVSKSEWNVYLTALVFGFFISGYFSMGYEVAVELSFPESESNSAALMNAFGQVFGVIFTLFFGWILTIVGHLWVNIGFSAILCLGTAVTALTKDVHRRQDSLNQQKYSYTNTPIADSVF